MEEEMEIDLIQLYHIVMRKKELILYITLAGMLISGICSYFFIKPVYKSTVSIIIGKEEAKYFVEDRYTNSDISLYIQVAKTYEEIAKSKRVQEQAKATGQYEEFQQIQDIEVASKTGTQVLTITVSHPSPAAAAAWADTLAEVFIQVASEVLPAGELKILDHGELPKHPASPNSKLNIAIGGVLGMMGAVGIIFLLEYMNPYVESERDIKYRLDLPVLGVIPQYREG